MPQNGSTTNTPIQTISGSVTDISATKVTISVNDVPLLPAVPVNNGQFNTAIVLTGGANKITITATDDAGLSSLTQTSNVIYNPLATDVKLTTPDGAVSGIASYTVTGTAPSGSTVTVNGLPATLAGTLWSVVIPLQAGVNPVVITATAPGGVETKLTSSVTYAPGQPTLAVTSPPADSATANAVSVISGQTDKGTSITASLDGVTLPVTVALDGSFTVVLPTFANPGTDKFKTYTVEITAIDGNGKISTVTRSLVYNPTPPALTVVDSTPSSIKVSSTNGVVIARDKTGIIPAATNGSAALDLSGVTYDAATLNIQVKTVTGLSSRNGDINGDGKVDIADALLAIRISLGAASASFEQLLRGDVGPLVNHKPVPDNKIGLDDAIMILQKSVGIDW
jgi:hypothetical protein